MTGGGPFPDAEFGWAEARPIRAVLDALTASGEARLVGGCVRDGLLGRLPARMAGGREGAAGTTDIDVATTLTPDRTTEALRAAGLAAHPTGVEHGTVTAVADGLPVEVTTLRADVATDGRHAEVAFTTDWDQDWRRRDFRVNAIYLGADGALFDPAGGRADLAARRVRFIGDPDERIVEDYLRILRFFRFTSRYAEEVDADGLAACSRGAAGMDRLSRERVWQEVSKTVSTPRAPEAFAAMEEAGVAERVVPEPIEARDFAALHRLLRGEVPVALGVEALWPTAEPDALAAAFKPPGAVLGRIGALREATGRLTPEEGAPLLRQLYQFGAEAVADASLLEAARTGEAAWLDHAGLARRVPVPVLPVRGKDLIARGLAPGPGLGEALKAIEAEWLTAGCPEGGERLDAVVGRALAEHVSPR